jgi:predicted dehydrogenase
MPSPLGLGLIGCGVISPVHFQAIQRVTGAKLVAVCDVIGERAQAAAEQYGAEAAYTDYRELLARDDVHAVHITTPSSLHHVVSIAASEAGKHSFVTKPIDVTLDAIDQMIAAAAANQVKLAVAHQFRAYASYGALRDAVAEGRLGEVHYANAFVPWWREQSYYTDRWQGTWEWDGGGALMNQSVHWVDLLLWIMGDVAQVAGFAATRAHEMETEDIGTAALQFASGAHGIIQGTTLTYRGMPTRLEVHGSKGNVIIEGDVITHWDVEGEEGRGAGPLSGETSASDPRAGLDDAVESHRVQIEAFLNWIAGTGAPLVTGPDARRAVELILAIYESQRTGVKVQLA